MAAAYAQQANVKSEDEQGQEIQYLCDIFLGAGSGNNRINFKQIQQTYEENDFEEAF